MAWSIFQQGGGEGAAVTWAKQLLAADNAPDTPATEQFIYDWEKSEGGGGKYNPLNQGPVPGHPELTTTGEQYGGGAADFASYAAGIQGAVDYLNMPNYTAVQAALKQGNAAGARSALIASPWAESHYGYGSSFSNAALPGQASALIGDPGTGSGTSSAANVSQSSLLFGNSILGSFFNGMLSGLFGVPAGSLSIPDITKGLKNLLVRGSLILFGAIILIIGLVKLTNADQKVRDAVTAVVPLPTPVKAKKSAPVGKEGSGASDDEGEKNKEGDGS